MKNLFNNPWFIAALGAFATVYLGVVLIGPMFEDDSVAESSAVPPLGLSFFDESSASDAAMPESELVNRELAIDKRSEIAWLHDVERDPFDGTLVGETDGRGDSALPRVAALFVGKGVEAAVLNNRLVRVGDEIERYRVTAIDAEHVLVTRAGRHYRLEPDV